MTKKCEQKKVKKKPNSEAVKQKGSPRDSVTANEINDNNAMKPNKNKRKEN